MEIIIRNKWISLGGSSVVKDSNEQDVFYVKGKVFSFTKKKYLQDIDHNLKFMIRNKFWRLFQRKALILNDKNEKVAEVSRKIFSLHDHYFVQSNLGDIQIRGNILQFNYTITLGDKEIGHISRKISLRDSFVLTIDDEFDPATFVALVIAIDLITDRRDNDLANN